MDWNLSDPNKVPQQIPVIDESVQEDIKKNVEQIFHQVTAID